VSSERAAVTSKVLIVGLRGCVCAVPLEHVIETMRPLSVEVISGLPSFVQGIALIRGIPTPVIDLGAILGAPGEAAGRFVTLRVGDKQVALSVRSVLGIRELDAITTVRDLPPLLQRASSDILETIGTLDEQVLMVLKSGWELPAEVWNALTMQEAVS
jgi:purine-binding chemotaxis protein CheW